MLRLESNTRAINHNVIAQCSTNNGGVGFHVREYGSLQGDLQIYSIPPRTNKHIGRSRNPIVSVTIKLPPTTKSVARFAPSIFNK
jgi:hypothetical protein